MTVTERSRDRNPLGAILFSSQGSAIAFQSFIKVHVSGRPSSAAIAQLGERKTEDLKVTGSIPVRGIQFGIFLRKGQGFYSFVFSSTSRHPH